MLFSQAMTPLHLAAQCGHTAVVGLLLSKDLDQLSSKDAQGYTSLHYAAYNGHLEMVSLLLGQGAEINSADKVFLYFKIPFLSISRKSEVII